METDLCLDEDELVGHDVVEDAHPMPRVDGAVHVQVRHKEADDAVRHHLGQLYEQLPVVPAHPLGQARPLVRTCTASCSAPPPRV